VVIVKFLALMVVAGLSAYGQHGHSGGGVGRAGGTTGGISSPAGNIPGSGENSERTTEPRKAGQQSPDTILERNTKLSSRLDGLLPTGTTAQQACSGFKNLGGCVSAIHVSHNLGIPFEELKGKLTGSSPQKLGQAIHELKPDVDAKTEAKKAQKQAKSDIVRTPEPVS
jgi:hypothetical protein